MGDLAISRKRIVIFGWSESIHIQRWVAGLSGRGYDIKVVSLGGDELPDIETTVVPRAGKRSYAIHLRQGVDAARAFKPDLIHAHYATGFAVWLKRTGFRPAVLSVWGSDIIDFPSNWMRRQIIRRYLYWPDHVTATSRFLGQKALDLAPRLKNRLSVIPFGVNVPEDIVPMATDGRVHLCYIKSHSPKYGPEILIDAVAMLLGRGCKVALSMAGTGPMTDQLQKQVAAHGITQQVEFVGFIPKEKMLGFLRQHHIMVMPSVLESESFGVAALEAAAAARPTIASHVGGVPEVVRDGETGVLVPPGNVRILADAIERLVRNQTLRERMGREGYDFVRKTYTWDRSLDLMCELYERLIDEYREK